MPLEHHPLVVEFPEHKDKIHSLKMADTHFHKLMEDYEKLDKEIFNIEDGSNPADDAVVENLKKQRLALKDEIFQMLNAD
jgi:hypothetical protein